jgi:hypothetical protein
VSGARLDGVSPLAFILHPGLPFSVDDGTGFLSDCPNTTSTSNGFGRLVNTKQGVGLGPQLPLPLLRQLPATVDASSDTAYGSSAINEIVNQPTDLRPLTERYCIQYCVAISCFDEQL